MSIQSTENFSRFEQLRVHLEAERYSPSTQWLLLPLAQHFFGYLEEKSIATEEFGAAALEDFLRWALRHFRKRNGRAPNHLIRWRERYLRVVQITMRLMRGHWPVVAEPATTLEAFHRDVAWGYDNWMLEMRGLATETRLARITEARRFLSSLGQRGEQAALEKLSVHEIDAYIKCRSAGLRRATIEGYTVCLRSLLRYLHNSKRITVDLSSAVIGPRIYDNEQIPSALRSEEIQRILDDTRQDRSPIGRRDHAFLMLLVTYGLRAGEIVSLCLEDFDWKKEILHVRHTKTGANSELPLLREPGEAVLRYLQESRPKSSHREIFIRMVAPYRPYKGGSILCSVIGTRLRAAGIVACSKRGPHAVRHARAASLLRAGVPLKTIGDVLGHRSEKSTAVYLKLGTEGLRAVGLDIPKGVSP